MPVQAFQLRNYLRNLFELGSFKKISKKGWAVSVNTRSYNTIRFFHLYEEYIVCRDCYVFLGLNSKTYYVLLWARFLSFFKAAVFLKTN